MKKPEDLEKWLRETAQSPEMKALVAKAESEPLPEELLMRYHAGLLTPEEEKFVAPLIALNENNLRFLAEVEDDIQNAVERTEPAGDLRARLADWATSFGAFWKSPYRALAGAVATVAFAAFLILLIDGPPGQLGPPYRSPLLEKPKTVGDTTSIPLPDGTELERVDPDWPFHQPLGDVLSAKWFTWRPLSGKDSYNYRLYSSDGSIVHERTGLTKSYLKLPGSALRSLEVGPQYVWVVETAGDRPSTVIRGVGRFRIVDR